MIAKSITIKGHGGISGGRAAKAVELTPGDLRGCLANGAERAARLVERRAEVSSGHNRRDRPLKAQTVRSGE